MQTLLKYATRPIAWLTFNPHTTLVISRRTESVVIDSPKLLRGCGSCPIRSSGQAASPAALLLRQKVWQRAGAISFLLMAAVIFSPMYHILFSKSSKTTWIGKVRRADVTYVFVISFKILFKSWFRMTSDGPKIGKMSQQGFFRQKTILIFSLCLKI